MSVPEKQPPFFSSGRTAARAAVAGTLCCLFAQQTVASIVEISITPNSQANSRPSIDTVFDVQATNGTFNDNLGIGIIINPTYIAANVQADFALHQNGNLYPVSAYSNFVPNPLTSRVTYRFNQPTIVSGIEIIEHFNGVTAVSGELGDSISTLSFIGAASSSLPMTDGTSVVFNFGNMTQSGEIFRLTIDQTFLSYAFAIHRAYLLDQNGNKITSAVPEPSAALLLAAGLASIFFARGRSTPKSLMLRKCPRVRHQALT